MLCSLRALTPKHPVIFEIPQNPSLLHKGGESAGFCWIPGHLKLPGNRSAEILGDLRGRGSDQRQCDHAGLSSRWSRNRDIRACFFLLGTRNGPLRRSTNCELWNYVCNCGNPPSGPPGGRSLLSTALNRPHTPDTWTLFGGEPAPLCSHSGASLVFSHILVWYQCYNIERRTYGCHGPSYDLSA
jgi:hypothetical protein